MMMMMMVMTMIMMITMIMIMMTAVSQGKAENSSNMMRNVVMKVGWHKQKRISSEDPIFPKDVERQPVNRPVTLLPSSRPEIQSGERPEITPSDEEFKPVQRDVTGWFERLNFALLLKLFSLSRCPWLC